MNTKTSFLKEIKENGLKKLYAFSGKARAFDNEGNVYFISYNNKNEIDSIEKEIPGNFSHESVLKLSRNFREFINGTRKDKNGIEKTVEILSTSQNATKKLNIILDSAKTKYIETKTSSTIDQNKSPKKISIINEYIMCFTDGMTGEYKIKLLERDQSISEKTTYEGENNEKTLHISNYAVNKKGEIKQIFNYKNIHGANYKVVRKNGQIETISILNPSKKIDFIYNNGEWILKDEKRDEFINGKLDIINTGDRKATAQEIEQIERILNYLIENNLMKNFTEETFAEYEEKYKEAMASLQEGNKVPVELEMLSQENYKELIRLDLGRFTEEIAKKIAEYENSKDSIEK